MRSSPSTGGFLWKTMPRLARLVSDRNRPGAGSLCFDDFVRLRNIKSDYTANRTRLARFVGLRRPAGYDTLVYVPIAGRGTQEDRSAAVASAAAAILRRMEGGGVNC